MEGLPDWAREARARWRYTGADRPPFARAPGPGQRSVWDFPRPPILETVPDPVVVRAGAVEIARTQRCVRVLETGSPPTYYLPADDVDRDALRPAAQRSLCEWKGEAHGWDLALPGDERPAVAWSYPSPFPGFERLRDRIAFYPGRVDCSVGSVRARPQGGGYYGGWITPELVGPFKGDPGVGPL